MARHHARSVVRLELAVRRGREAAVVLEIRRLASSRPYRERSGRSNQDPSDDRAAEAADSCPNTKGAERARRDNGPEQRATRRTPSLDLLMNGTPQSSTISHFGHCARSRFPKHTPRCQH